MGHYIVTKRKSICTVTDTDNGVTVEWLAGAFNDTQETTADPDGVLLRTTPTANVPAALARVRRDMYEHVLFTRPELLQ